MEWQTESKSWFWPAHTCQGRWRGSARFFLNLPFAFLKLGSILNTSSTLSCLPFYPFLSSSVIFFSLGVSAELIWKRALVCKVKASFVGPAQRKTLALGETHRPTCQSVPIRAAGSLCQLNTATPAVRKH